MFDFLAKITKKVANKPDADFIYDENFPICYAGDLFIMGDTKISEISNSKTDFINRTFNVYNPKTAKAIAKSINDGIQEQMIDYFL